MQVYRGLALLPKTSCLFTRFWRPDISVYMKFSHTIWRQEEQILERHTGYINHSVFSPDGSILASASLDKTVRLWNVATGTAIGSALEGYNLTVNHMVFSPDSTKLATASLDNTVHLWNVATGTTIGSLLGHNLTVNHMVFSSDGTKIATASRDNIVHLWNVATGTAIRLVLEEHNLTVKYMVFSSDDTKLATALWNNTVLLWDVATGIYINNPSLDIQDSFNMSMHLIPDAIYGNMINHMGFLFLPLKFYLWLPFYL